jgi:two-component sensor histidine kinase
LLVNELNHRVKNTLATVQSIAGQTLRAGGADPQVHEALEGRLIALARAHDVLTQESWDRALLKNIVAMAAAPYGGRMTCSGPDADVAPQPALALSLVLHELATNAAKYGALSAPEGRVSIEWSVDRSSEDVLLNLRWRELNGPMVQPPKRKGFGSRLIERGLADQPNARVELDFPQTGVVCSITLSLGGADRSA